MKFIKFLNVDGYVVFINPQFVESIAGMEVNTKIVLTTGNNYDVGISPYEVVEKLTNDKGKSGNGVV